ncbi:MAG: amidohydrolase [Sphingobacteriales bacterium]|nr:MAG: amidohydrolase [Sphingobacteriales bacterium]
MTQPLRFTIVQSDISWEAPELNFRHYEALLAQEVTQYPLQVVLLPELFATGFSMNTALAEPMKGPTVDWMRSMARQHRCILSGSVMIREDDRIYNRFIWMQPDGLCHTYDKRHLFAYAGEDAHYTAGDRRVIVQVMGWKICLQICYDLRFPVWSRNVPGPSQYDVLVYIASWPARRALAWNTLLPARAIENQAFVIGVNRTGPDGNEIAYAGDSAVYGPDGSPMWQVGGSEQIHSIVLDGAMLQAFRDQFPFLRDADSFSLL